MNAAVVGIDDRGDRRKAESPTRSLRGDVRVKHALQQLRLDAGPRVGKLEHNALAGGDGL